MLCYKDKTFCNFKDCKKHTKEQCDRVPSELELQYSKDLGIPMCWFYDRPPCFEKKDEK